MVRFRLPLSIALISSCGLLAACGGSSEDVAKQTAVPSSRLDREAAASDGSSMMSMFGKYKDPSTAVEVNRYLWDASLEVLNFLPIESADPFTGIISTGFGTPPGGKTAYRATIQISDAALDARSLNLSISTRNGVASADTVRAVENAILTRARQLRIADQKY